MAEPAAETTVDALLGGRIRLAQPRRGARVAVDAILLAAAVEARPGERLLELGAGVGAVSLCVAARLAGCEILGLEREADLVALANANAAANGMSARCRFVAGDVADPPREIREAAPYAAVFLNPPHLAAAAADPPPQTLRRRAFVEEGAGLPVWIRTAHRLLAHAGRILLIHRADRLDEVIAALRPRRLFGDIRILPVQPRTGEPARRVIVHARKGLRSPATLLPPLVLHRAGGGWSEAAERILRAGEGLSAVVGWG